MKVISTKDWIIAAAVGLVMFVTVWAIEQKLTTLALTSGVIGFLVPVCISILTEIRVVSRDIRAQESIFRIKDPLLSQLALTVLNEKFDSLREIDDKRVQLDSEAAMMKAYYLVFDREDAGSSIDATSMVSIDGVWGQARGKKAFDVNKAAVKKNVKIRRVFIFPDGADLSSDKMTQLFHEQKEAGIEVSYVLHSKLNTGLAEDFLVTGSKRVLKFETDLQGALIKCTFSSNISDAEQYRQIFDQIHGAATLA